MRKQAAEKPKTPLNSQNSLTIPLEAFFNTSGLFKVVRKSETQLTPLASRHTVDLFVLFWSSFSPERIFMGSLPCTAGTAIFPKTTTDLWDFTYFSCFIKRTERTQSTRNRNTTQLCTLLLEDNPGYHPHINLKRTIH